jgi:hypothetical protein
MIRRTLSRCAIAFAAGAAATAAAGDDREVPFEEADLFFELNDTDGDLGIHGSIDGGPWVRLTITDPNEREILAIAALRRLRKQGMTQLFFESAEPPFDELTPSEFFLRFPEGVYEIEGVLQDGGELESTDRLRHVMPAPPSGVRVSGMPAAESCDSPVLPVVSRGAPVEIRWNPVTTSHPRIGRKGPVRIVRYQLFVGGLSLDLPPSVTAFDVPPEVLDPDEDVVKFEIIATEATGNNTAVESCFEVR